MAKQIDLKKFFQQILGEEPDLSRGLEAVVSNALTGLIKAKKGKGIGSYLDSQKIKDALKRMQKRGYDDEKIQSRVYEGISGGKYLTVRGQEILLKNRLKYNPTLLQKIIHPVHSIKRVVNPSYSEKVIHAVTEIMQYAEAGGLKDQIPEWLVNDAAKLQDLYFLGTATKIFEDYGLMSKSEARNLEYLADKKVRSEGEAVIRKTKEEIKKYGAKTPGAAAVAASVLLIASFLLLGFSAGHMTGFVVAGNKIPAGYPIGAGFILLLIALRLSFIRKKGKKQQQKK